MLRLALPLALLLAAPALAQDRGDEGEQYPETPPPVEDYPETPPPVDGADDAEEAPDVEREPETYEEMVQRGIALLNLGDRGAARLAFEAAEQGRPDRAEAIYYQGVTHRLAAQRPDAVEDFRRAAAVAAQAAPRWTARALHGVASTLERIDGKLDEARTAWQALGRFARAHPEAIDPAIPDARVAAIDAFAAREVEAAATRERAAARRRSEE